LLFRYTDLLDQDLLIFLTLVGATLLALVVGIGFHEFCHAFMADSLGDPLPARQGRVTLNPLAHLDPAGTVMMLFVGFGWRKPVQWSGQSLRVSPKMAMLMISAAGPLSNFVAAGLLGLPIKLGWVPFINPFDFTPFGLGITVGEPDEYVGLFLTASVLLNVVLGVFNLLPIHPLDGFKVVAGLLPDDLSQEFMKLGQYGPAILMVLIALPFFTGYNPLGDVMAPTVLPLIELFTGVN
jgi:Zn-dependent protease